jgi:3-methylcrotonyl-CoA carboxylase alpha subunit
MGQVINKILVANRGEIACRVMHTCQELGIKTVAIFTQGEEDSLHVQTADESFCLGSGALSETYLNKQKILTIAKESKVSAIHPGYGFLSENADFCELIEKNKIIFIGPKTDHINLMGDKITSKKKMMEIGVPVIPGYQGDNQDSENLKKQANIIGFPVLIKATAGGGGKGMRIVQREENFFQELEAAKREALSSFGNDHVLIEKYITKPRHIEVQVMSDTHGNHLHFFERECSIQRRYQKIVEETPSVALDEELRIKICETAVIITKEIKYRGAGTVEFILDTDGKFYFLEMNTRLQVEHPITELVTGSDLVYHQINVSLGRELNITQNEILQRGHAIEVRIYAEDPENNFFPTTGTVKYIGVQRRPGVRLDTGIKSGDEVGVNFDPMVAKLITYASTREQCIEKMKKAIIEYPFLGLKTNREYLLNVLAHKEFIKGETFTDFVAQNKEINEIKTSREQLAQVALVHYISNQNNSNPEGLNVGKQHQSIKDFHGFRNQNL